MDLCSIQSEHCPMPREADVSRPRSHDVPRDSPEYVAAWARDLVDAVGKREARLALAGYKAIAANKRLNKTDREVAVERVNALEKRL